MDYLNAACRFLMSTYGTLFGDAHPLWSLTPLSIATGIAMLWVFARTSNQKAILRTKKQLQAYLLELRLYGDDFSLIWRAQVNLVLGNFRYIGLMMKPAIYLVVPTVILLVHLDAFYGMKPLAAGETATLTVQAAEPIAADSPAPTIEPPPGIVIDTPAVRIVDRGQFSWRIRAEQPADGELRFSWRDSTWEKSVSASPEPRYLSVRRVSSLWESIIDAGEDRLSAPAVSWVEIRYPAASIDLAGWDFHWLVWFLVISIAAGYLLKGWFKVTI